MNSRIALTYVPIKYYYFWKYTDLRMNLLFTPQDALPNKGVKVKLLM